MVQVLEEAPSFGSLFGRAIGQGAGEGLTSAMQKKQKMAQLAKEDEEIFNSTGINLRGILDPELRKARFTEELKGKNKEALLDKKQGFLSEILGKKNGSFGNERKSITARGAQAAALAGEDENLQQSEFDPTSVSDEQIALATAIDPNLGRSLQHSKDVALREKREEEKKLFEREKYEYGKTADKEKIERHEALELNKPLFKELDASRKNIPLQEQAILDIQEASPQVSALDYFADITGFEPLRSAEGVKLKTGIKDFFLSDLTRAGARPNMWIEQQLADALPKIGRSAEANLITAEGMKFKLDLAKKRIDTIDELMAKDREKFGFVKPDVDARAFKEMKKYVIDRQKDLHDNIKKIKAQYRGKKDAVRMKSPEGSIYEILSDDIDEALEHGYEFSK